MTSKLAVLVTCYNRAEVTGRALDSLIRAMPPGIEWRIFAVDDNSSDGTLSILRGLGDGVEVIVGSGSLYWAGGMRLAESAALRWQPDYYLWFNDDAQLDILETGSLLNTVISSGDRKSVWVGALSSSRGTILYGPRQRVLGNPLAFEITSLESRAATFNGNFVLIPADVVTMVGGVPAGYRHGYADLVFGLRCAGAGVVIRTWTNPVGRATENASRGKMFSPNVNLRSRVQFAWSPFGLPPRDQFRFCRERTGWRGCYWFLRGYLRVLAPKRR
jgi:GT2 family glycosyltransferase